MGHREDLVIQRFIKEAEVQMQKREQARAKEREREAQKASLINAIEEEMRRIADALTDKDWAERASLRSPFYTRKHRWSILVFLGLKQEDFSEKSARGSELAVIELFSLGEMSGFIRSDGLLHIISRGHRVGSPQSILANYSQGSLQDILALLKKK